MKTQVLQWEFYLLVKPVTFTAQYHCNLLPYLLVPLHRSLPAQSRSTDSIKETFAMKSELHCTRQDSKMVVPQNPTLLALALLLWVAGEKFQSSTISTVILC